MDSHRLRPGLGVAGVALSLTIAAGGASAADGKPFTMGYSVGFLTDPFQVIQADLTVAEGKKAGLKTLPVANAQRRSGQADHRLPQPDRRGRAGHHRGADATATRSCRR